MSGVGHELLDHGLLSEFVEEGSGNNILHLLVGEKLSETLKIFLKDAEKGGFLSKYNINQKNEKGMTLVDIAIHQHDIYTLEFLVTEFGIPFDIKTCEGVRDENGNGLLHHCATLDFEEGAKLLLSHGFDVNMLNNDMDEFTDGGHVLHSAAISGSTRVLKLFLAQPGISINSQANPARDTPLHLACRFGKSESVRLLLEAGARTDLVNSHGLTPIKMAQNEGCLKLLADK